MRAHMPSDHVSPAGSVWAERALVRFLTRVGPLVRAQVVATAEHLTAHFAGIRLDARVEPHMSSEHVTSRKRSLANVAHIGLRSG